MEQIFPKNKTIYKLFKNIASENTHSLYMEWERIYFSCFYKKLKNICSHLLWSENAKIFPEKWRKIKNILISQQTNVR